ncbi:uncharacterized protein LOC129809049 isoform X2 [Phlebotomus papatasi]|uniref:uncharacterized protein LOC129809049 isoform X2 n=1 Tax=Phlebotomus papatasi TaxID=29031 RepID=UPI002483AB13|nr:uncharacterized protein LOC129809049 isoform X2 [Phlebotomus papatasi]
MYLRSRSFELWVPSVSTPTHYISLSGLFFSISAKNLYGIDGQIYFTNDFGTRLQDDAVFSVYIQTYARSPNFALIVNQEEKVGVQNEDPDTGDVPETGIFIDTTEMNDDNDLPKTDTDKKSSEETDVKLNSEVKGKTIQQTQIDGEEKLLKTTVKDLSHLLEAHQLKYILQEYESDGKLKQSSQKTFVYMVSNHIISLAGHYPSKRVKIHMAKLCADLFPSYKRNTENYYELFYDPISKGGLLFSRLNYLRERNLKLTGSGKYKTKKSEEQEQDEPTPSTSSTLTAGEIREAEEHIEFLQHATIAQKEQIIETFKKNKKHRQMNRQSIIQDYKSCITLMPTLNMAQKMFRTYGQKSRLKLTNTTRTIQKGSFSDWIK